MTANVNAVVFRLAALWITACLFLSTGVFASNDSWQQSLSAGNLALSRGQNVEAEKYYEDALAQAEKFGEKDPRLAISLNSLASTYQVEQKYSAALPLFERLLNIREKAKRDGVEVASVLEATGEIYFAQKNYPEAERVYLRWVGL